MTAGSESDGGFRQRRSDESAAPSTSCLQSDGASADLHRTVTDILDLDRFFSSGSAPATSSGELPTAASTTSDGARENSPPGADTPRVPLGVTVGAGAGADAGKPSCGHGGRGGGPGKPHAVFVPNTSPEEMAVLLGEDRGAARALAQQKAEHAHVMAMHQAAVFPGGVAFAPFWHLLLFCVWDGRWLASVYTARVLHRPHAPGQSNVVVLALGCSYDGPVMDGDWMRTHADA